MVPSRTQSAALVAERYLAFPQCDLTPRRDHHPPAFASLAVVLTCLTFVAGVSVAYHLGQQVERGAEFGQLVALQALEPEIRQAAQRCGAEAQRLASLGLPRPRISRQAPASTILAPERLPVTLQKVAAP